MPKKSKVDFDKKQAAFLLAPLKRQNLLFGAVRSGKTYISLIKWALWIMRQDESEQFLMVGKTITSLHRNCLTVLENILGSTFSYSLTAKKADIFGHTVWLEGANDERSESKIRGMTLKGAYIDELTQIPRGFYLMVLSRLSERGAALIATTNPDSPNHYVKTDIIDNAAIERSTNIWQFTFDDNTHLDEAYKESLKREYTGVYYRRFILGEFVRAEGVIFPDFADNPTPYIISAELLPSRFQNVEVGFDIGGNGSAYALTCTARGFDGIQYKLKSEKRQAEAMAMSDVEKFVVEFCDYVENKYKTRIDIINCDHVDVIINTINDNTKYRAAKCYKPPLEDRVFLYSKLLATGKVKFVAGECDDLIEEMRNLVFDERTDKAIPLDDGTMQIDTWDSNIYSESGYWDYLEA